MPWNFWKRMTCWRRIRDVGFFLPSRYMDMLTKDAASPCPRRTRCNGRVGLSMGCPALLFVPGSNSSLFNHGISPWWRSHDYAHKVWHVFRGCDKVLYCPMCNGNWSCTSTWVHPSVSFIQTCQNRHYWSKNIAIVTLSQIISWCKVGFNPIIASK